MDRAIWYDILQGIGLFFVHPLFYLGILIMVIIGIRRVRRERADFHIKVFDFMEELVSSIKPGFLIGAILSVVFVGMGLVLTPTAIIVIALAYILLTLTFRVRLLSPAFVLPIVFILLFILADRTFDLPLLGEVSFWTNSDMLFHIFLLFTLLLIAEGLCIRYFSWKNTSPRLFLSARGKYIGGHETQRLWAIPIFMLVPNGAIPSFMEWPFFPVMTEDSYSLVLVPFFIGFQLLVKSTTPKEALQQVGNRVLLLGILMLLVAVGGYFYSLILIIGAFLMLLLREAIFVAHKLADEGKASLFRLRERGVIVLGILPDSPAEKLGIKIGEVIMNVNDVEVSRPMQFYEALQKKAASCKLEVVDFNGEVRILQTALYDGEHHELGVLLVKEDYTYQDSIV